MTQEPQWTPEDVERILANPLHCLHTIDPQTGARVEPRVEREIFIKAGVRFIREEGAEKYLGLLLDNLTESLK